MIRTKRQTAITYEITPVGKNWLFVPRISYGHAPEIRGNLLPQILGFKHFGVRTEAEHQALVRLEVLREFVD